MAGCEATAPAAALPDEARSGESPLRRAKVPVELLRFATVGSVDDGKSTLIGRLLHDTRQVFADQLEQVRDASERRGDAYLDLALLTDGLRAEREQGITIDVAYRYFQTARRRFIIADTPGHRQYTRNMVTGASTADLALVLVDARAGVVEQTRRHLAVSALLGIPNVVLCVNKMDLVGWDRDVFDGVRDGFAEVARLLGHERFDAVPISALEGDNVVGRSDAAPWYGGPSLLELLEEAPVAAGRDLGPLRFPVQWVIRPQSAEHPDYRGYAGRIEAGTVRVGDEVEVQPSGLPATVAAIDSPTGPLDEAFAPMSIVLRLAQDLDISRGATIAAATEPALVVRELEADLCWMGEQPLTPGSKYFLKHATTTVRAVIDSVEARLDLETLEPDADATSLELNDLGRVRLRTSAPLAVDRYSESRGTGSFILIDEVTNDTVAAGMVG